MSITTYTSCLRIERTDGYVICLTELDKDLNIPDSGIDISTGDTQIYLSAAGYTPTNMQSTSDNAVNNADVEGVLSSIGVQREDIIGGRYDFAKLHIFLWDWKNNTLVKKLGSGHWGEATIKDGSYVAEFRSLSQQLQQTIGRTYNPECDEQLGGPRCGITLGLFPKLDGTVTTDTSKDYLFDTSLVKPDDYWNGSVLTWNSGVNNGSATTVTDYTLATQRLDISPSTQFVIDRDASFTIIKDELANEVPSDIGSTISFIDTARTEANDFFIGSTAYIYSGPNIDNTKTVSAFSNGKFTFSSADTNFYSISDKYLVHKLFTGNITVIDTQRTQFQTDLTDIDDYFNGSILTFTSGNNVGSKVLITNYIQVNGVITIPTGLPNDIDISSISITKIFKGSILGSQGLGGTVTTVLNPRTLIETNVTDYDEFLTGRTLVFTSGANNGIGIAIVGYSQSNGTIELAEGLSGDIVSSDTFTIDVIVYENIVTDENLKIQFEDSTRTESNSYFNGLTLEFTSGLNISETFLILDFTNNIFTLDSEATNDILITDEYKVTNIHTSTTSTGASLNIFEDTSIIGPTDYTGMYIEFTSGNNEGENRLITSHNLVTGSIVLNSNLLNYILNADEYLIINTTGDTYMSFGEVESRTDNATFICSTLNGGPYADDYFNYGKLIFKSGLNDEIHMEVKDFNGTTGEFSLFLPMPFEISIGDNFQVFAGCDKRLVTCKDKFSNIINFQGFPYIPGQDQISLFGGQ